MKYNEIAILKQSLIYIKTWEQYIIILHKINKIVNGYK